MLLCSRKPTSDSLVSGQAVLQLSLMEIVNLPQLLLLACVWLSSE